MSRQNSLGFFHFFATEIFIIFVICKRDRVYSLCDLGWVIWEIEKLLLSCKKRCRGTSRELWDRSANLRCYYLALHKRHILSQRTSIAKQLLVLEVVSQVPKSLYRVLILLIIVILEGRRKEREVWLGKVMRNRVCE